MKKILHQPLPLVLKALLFVLCLSTGGSAFAQTNNHTFCYTDHDGDGYGDPNKPVVYNVVVGCPFDSETFGITVDNSDDCDDNDGNKTQNCIIDLDPIPLPSPDYLPVSNIGNSLDPRFPVLLYVDMDGDGYSASNYLYTPPGVRQTGGPYVVPQGSYYASQLKSTTLIDCDDFNASINLLSFAPSTFSLQVPGCSLSDISRSGLDISTTVKEITPAQFYGAGGATTGCGIVSATYIDAPDYANNRVNRTFTVTDVVGNTISGTQEISFVSSSDLSAISPSKQQLCLNVQPATLNITLGLLGGTVKWYSSPTSIFSDAEIIPGAIEASYSPPASGIDGSTFYFAVVTDVCGKTSRKVAEVLFTAQSNTWYKDLDNDNYYDPAYGGQQLCASPGAGYKTSGLLGEDCNDNDATINPETQWYLDADNDGYALQFSLPVTSCTPPQDGRNYTRASKSGDCNDNDALSNPESVWVMDKDGDGFYTGVPSNGCPLVVFVGMVIKTIELPGDCDDNNAEVNPALIWYKDADNDGYSDGVQMSQCTRPEGYKLPSELYLLIDCDDANAALNPSTTWVLDADGDGYYTKNPITYCSSPAAGYVIRTTQRSGDCDDANAAVHAAVQYYVDGDGDGYGSTATAMLCALTAPAGYSTNNTDCNDNDKTKHSSFNFYIDNDGDGYGSGSLVSVCAVDANTPPTGHASNNTDCNDNNNTKWQSATLYVDADGDGYTVGNGESVCYGTGTPSGYKASKSGVNDCNDGNAAVGAPPTWYKDADGDGYYTGSGVTSCTSPGTGYRYSGLTGGGDCVDNNAAIRPGATEICGNGIDDNCNGQVDENCAVCGNATRLTTTNITSTTATLNWIAAINPVQWQVQYKAKGSKWVDVLLAGTLRSKAITGLKANQTYQWHIRAKCGKVWTAYSSSVSFKTTIARTLTSNSARADADVVKETLLLQVVAQPNPSTTYFTLRIQSSSPQAVNLQMADAVGRIVEGKTGLASNTTLYIGQNYRPGVYYAQVMQGGKIVSLKLVKQ